jgi:hypothetical protein
MAAPSFIEIAKNLTLGSYMFPEMKMTIGVRENCFEEIPQDGPTTNSLSWLEPSIDKQFMPALESSLANWTMLAMTHVGCKWKPDYNITAGIGPFECGHYGLNITQGNWPGTNFLSTACVFYPCAKHYFAFAIAGTLTEKLVSENPAILVKTPRAELRRAKATFYAISSGCSIDSVWTNLTTVNEILRIPDQDSGIGDLVVNLLGKPTKIPSDCYSAMDDLYASAVTEFLSENLKASCQSNVFTESSFAKLCDVPRDDNEERNDRWWLAAFANRGNATFESVSMTMKSVADTVTNQMRYWTGGNQSENRFVYGEATEFGLCTRFSPAWLLMPTVLLLLGLVLTAVTVLGKGVTESVPVWKDSILPLVSTGPVNDTVRYAGKVGEMERAAGKLDAVLQQRDLDGKWALVVEHRSDGEDRA